MFLLRKVRLRWWHHALLLLLPIAVTIGYAVGVYRDQLAVLAPFEPYLEQYIAVSDSQPGPPYIRGRVITVSTRGDELDLLYFDLPEELRARQPEEVQTVIWLDCTSATRVHRSIGTDTVSYTCDVTIIDYTIPAVIARQSFDKESGEAGYRDVLYPEIARFLAGLPRR